MLCANCGREIGDDARFCKFCGHKLAEAEARRPGNMISSNPGETVPEGPGEVVSAYTGAAVPEGPGEVVSAFPGAAVPEAPGEVVSAYPGAAVPEGSVGNMPVPAFEERPENSAQTLSEGAEATVSFREPAEPVEGRSKTVPSPEKSSGDGIMPLHGESAQTKPAPDAAMSKKKGNTGLVIAVIIVAVLMLAVGILIIVLTLPRDGKDKDLEEEPLSRINDTEFFLQMGEMEKRGNEPDVSENDNLEDGPFGFIRMS